jgi:hypothetical protein
MRLRGSKTHAPHSESPGKACVLCLAVVAHLLQAPSKVTLLLANLSQSERSGRAGSIASELLWLFGFCMATIQLHIARFTSCEIACLQIRLKRKSVSYSPLRKIIASLSNFTASSDLFSEAAGKYC